MDAMLVSPKAKASNSRCSIYKTKDRAGWKLGKDKFLSHLQPHGDIQSEDLAIYDFSI